MKLSPLTLPIIAGIFILVDGQKGCRRRRIKYVQPILPPPPPPPPPTFTCQSFDDDIIGRDVGNTDNPNHPNLSCLLFADDGCNVSCNLMCDINGCQSDGYCSQKLYCHCNEVYFIENQAISADQFKKLTFEDLWAYKFKSSNNSPNLKNRIFQSKQLYNFIMPLLQNPHISGRDIKQALIQKYPKLSSAAENLLPREHGVKTKLFGDNEAGENLHQYIQSMMNTIQNSIYDRLSHMRYMRRIINLIKNIDNKDDLSYILRQIRQIGNERLFERVRRYLMKRGYFFDDDLRPISKKAGFCMKKKAKCKCKKKFKSKPKRFFYNYGNTFVNDEDDSDWVEDEEEVIELALINELIGSNNAEGKYPSNTILDKQPLQDAEYTMGQIDEEVPFIEDTIITKPSPTINAIADKNTQLNKNPMIPQNDASYVITSGGSGNSAVISKQPKKFTQQMNYPEYEVPILEDTVITKPSPTINAISNPTIPQSDASYVITSDSPGNSAITSQQPKTFVQQMNYPEYSYETPVTEDTTIMKPPQTTPNVTPENTIQFNKNSIVTPTDTTYVITSDTPNSSEIISLPPNTYVQQINYPEYNIPIIEDGTITNSSQATYNVLPDKITKFNQNSMAPSTHTTYAITSNTPDYFTNLPQQPKIYLQNMKYPEYGTFLNGAGNDYIFEKPQPDSFSNTFTNYDNQPISNLFTSPQTMYFEEKTQPSTVPLQNPNTATMEYTSKPTSTPLTISSQTGEQAPQTIVMEPQVLHSSSNIENIPQLIKPPTPPFMPKIERINESTIPSPQLIQKPSKPLQPSQNLADLTHKITTSSQKLENQKPQLIKPAQNLLQQFITEKPAPKIPETSPYLHKPLNTEDLKVLDIPDTSPSVESSFVKHHYGPETTSTMKMLPPSPQTSINRPESYTEYFIEDEKTTPSLPESQASPKVYSESSYSSSLPEPNLPQIETATPYNNYDLVNNNNNFDAPPTYPLSSDNFADYHNHIPQMSSPETQSTKIPPPPVMQPPKNKIYYQILMDENGNIIKSANYQYANQPQYYQDTQLPSGPIPQYTPTTGPADQPLLDKFDKQTLLNAAKAKPGESVAIDYDLENTDNIPVFDIPSDIDMASGTLSMSPDAFNEYVMQHNENSGNNWETMPISYTTEDSYNVMNSPGIIKAQNTGMNLLRTDTQYPFEIDNNNLQIQTNDGLTLDYEENGAGNNNWSTYSISDTGPSNNLPIDYQNYMIDMDNMLVKNGPGTMSNGNDMMHYDLNSDEGAINIEIHDGPDYADGNALTHKSEYSAHNSKNFLAEKGNGISQNLNSDENSITIDIMGESNSAEGNINKYGSSSKSSSVIKTSYQASSKTTNNNTVPVKVISHVDPNSSKNGEDISTACDFPVDPEDDLLNF
ncbi:uncharacterized protein LOC135843775 [Planococcus citri]|uniref:uncharacterized protein LOC135843775 n=1 Tax=Planococcus citri TaxID=170843 RepID=UPI0031F87763